MRLRVEFEVDMTEEQFQALRDQLRHSRVWSERLEQFFGERFGIGATVVPGRLLCTPLKRERKEP